MPSPSPTSTRVDAEPLSIEGVRELIKEVATDEGILISEAVDRILIGGGLHLTEEAQTYFLRQGMVTVGNSRLGHDRKHPT